MTIKITNRKQYNAQMDKNIRSRNFVFLTAASEGIVAETKLNVPPTKKQWPARPGYGYKAKGRLQRAIHTEKPKGRLKTMNVSFGVLKRGKSVRSSARAHEFGKVITSSKGMKFRIVPRGQLIITKKVVLRPKRYLRQGINRGLANQLGKFSGLRITRYAT